MWKACHLCVSSCGHSGCLPVWMKPHIAHRSMAILNELWCEPSTAPSVWSFCHMYHKQRSPPQSVSTNADWDATLNETVSHKHHRHTSQRTSLSHVFTWVFVCFLRRLLNSKHCSHSRHWNDFPLIWIFKWTFKLYFCENVLVHLSQEYDFWSEWIVACLLRSPRFLYDFSYITHSTVPHFTWLIVFWFSINGVVSSCSGKPYLPLSNRWSLYAVSSFSLPNLQV